MVKRIIIALIIAHFLTAAHCLIWLLPGNLATIKANFFIQKSAMPKGMELIWYYKFLSEFILHSVTYCCFAALAYQYSRKLFFVVGIWNLYHFADFIMFLINNNTWWWLYILFGVLIIMAIIVACKPIKETGRVVSMQ